jgi:hypothetical protein
MPQPFRTGRAIVDPSEVAGFEDENLQPEVAPLEATAPTVVKPAAAQPLSNPWDTETGKAFAAPPKAPYIPSLTPAARVPGYRERKAQDFKHRLSTFEQEREAALERSNTQFQEQAARSGAKTVRGADGVLRHATDDKGTPLFTPSDWDMEEAPEGRAPVNLVRRNERGDIEAKPAPVVHNRADPSDPFLYRDFGKGRVVKIGHVDDLQATEDPVLKSAAIRLNEQRQKEIAARSMQAFQEQELSTREELLKIETERSSLAKRRAEIGQTRAQLDADTALSSEDRTARDAALQSELESIAARDREFSAKEPALKLRAEQTRLERDTLKLEFDKSRYANVAETIAQRLIAAGKDPKKDPVYQAALARAEELNAGVSEVAKERSRLSSFAAEAEKRARDAIGAESTMEGRAGKLTALAGTFEEQATAFDEERKTFEAEVDEFRKMGVDVDPAARQTRAVELRAKQASLAARAAELSGTRQALLSGQESIKAEFDARSKERAAWLARGQARLDGSDKTPDGDGSGLAMAYSAARGGDKTKAAKSFIEKTGATVDQKPYVALPGGGIVLHPDFFEPIPKKGTPEIAAVMQQAVKAGEISEDAAKTLLLQEQGQQRIIREAAVDQFLTNTATQSQAILDTSLRDWLQDKRPDLVPVYDSYKVGLTASPSDRSAFAADPALRAAAFEFMQDQDVPVSAYFKDLPRLAGSVFNSAGSFLFSVGGQVGGNLANLVGANSVEGFFNRIRDVGLDADRYWMTGTDSRLQGTRWDTYSQAVASGLSFLLSAFVTRGAGTSLKMAEKIGAKLLPVVQQSPKLAKWLGYSGTTAQQAGAITIGRASTIAVGAGMTAGGFLSEMRDMGILDEERGKSWLVLAASLPIGATELVPMERWMGKVFDGPKQAFVRKSFIKSARKHLGDAILKGAIPEAGQEVLQTYMENLTAKIVYDASREWDEGMREAAEAGGFVGAVFDLAAGAINGARFARANRQMTGAFTSVMAARAPIDQAFQGWRGRDFATIAEGLSEATGATVSPQEAQAVRDMIGAAPIVQEVDAVEARRSAAEREAVRLIDESKTNAAIEPEAVFEARQNWLRAEQESVAARRSELGMATLVARGRQQALSLPDFQETAKDGQPVTNPATVNTFRQAAQALMRVALGSTDSPARMSEADTQALQTLGQVLGSEMVRWEPGKRIGPDGALVDTQEAVITDKARDWLNSNVEAAKPLTSLSEVERRDRIAAEATQAEIRAIELAEQTKPTNEETLQGQEGQLPEAPQVTPASDATQPTAVPQQPASEATDQGATSEGPATASPEYARQFSEQAVSAKIEEALAAPVNPGAADRFAALRSATPEARQQFARVLSTELAAKSTALDYLVKFAGGAVAERDVTAPAVSGGARYVPGKGIEVDWAALLESQGGVQVAAAKGADGLAQRIDRVFSEEAVHILAKQAIPDAEMVGWYESVPEPLRAASWQAYNANREGVEVTNPLAAGHELFRQMVQGRIQISPQGLVFDDKVVMPSTEETGAFSTKFKEFLGRLVDMIGQFRQALTGDTSQGAQAAAKQFADFEQRIQALNEQLMQGGRVERTAGVGAQTAVGEVADRESGTPPPAPVSTVPSAEGDTNREGAATSATGAAPSIPSAPRASEQDVQAANLPAEQVGAVETVSHKGFTARAAYAVVEADWSTPSHNLEGKPEPGYNQDWQPRDRGANPQYKVDVRQQAATPLIAEDRKSGGVEGVPIVAVRNGRAFTIVGNGRDLAKKAMYASPDLAPVAETYRRDVVQLAIERGIPAETVQRLKHPVLVRVLTDRDLSDSDLRELGRLSNENSASEVTAGEQAQSDAQYLTPEILSLLEPRHPLTAPANRDFLDAATRALYGKRGVNKSKTDRAQRIQRAVFGAAYGGSPEARAAFDRLIGDSSDEARNLGNALLAAAPSWASMRAAMRLGQVDPRLDITEAVLRGVQEISNAITNRAEDVTVAAALSPLETPRMDLGDQVELESEVLRVLLATRKSKTAVRTVLTAYTDSALASTAVALPGTEDTRTPAEIWRDATAQVTAFAAAPIESQLLGLEIAQGNPTDMMSLAFWNRPAPQIIASVLDAEAMAQVQEYNVRLDQAIEERRMIWEPVIASYAGALPKFNGQTQTVFEAHKPLVSQFLVRPTPKGVRRIVEKVVFGDGAQSMEAFQSEILQLKDIAGATYVIQEAEASDVIERAVLEAFGLSEQDKARVSPKRNLKQPDPKQMGYRDNKLRVQFDGRHWGEVIVLQPNMAAAKSGIGHTIYEVQRVLDLVREMAIKSKGKAPSSISEILSASVAVSNRLYGAAAFADEANSLRNSSSDTNRWDAPTIMRSSSGGNTSGRTMPSEVGTSTENLGRGLSSSANTETMNLVPGGKDLGSEAATTPLSTQTGTETQPLAAPTVEIDAATIRGLNNDALLRRKKGEHAQHPIGRVLSAIETLRSDSGDNRWAQAAGTERGRVRGESAARDRGTFAAAEAIARRGEAQLRRAALADFPDEAAVRDAEEKGRPAEDAALRRWARTNGILLDWQWFDSQWQSGGRMGGLEHEVFLRARDGRWWKRTTMPLSGPSWVSYFQRMQIHAALFPETAYRLEGIMQDRGGKIWVVTSQPDIISASAPVSPTDVQSMMSSIGFVWKPAISGGWNAGDQGDTNRYYHPDLGLWVGDVHAGNALRRESGGLAIIDPVIVLARRGSMGAAMAGNEGMAFKQAIPADDAVDESLPAARVEDAGMDLFAWADTTNTEVAPVEETVAGQILVETAITEAKGDRKKAAARVKKAAPQLDAGDLFNWAETQAEEVVETAPQQQPAAPANQAATEPAPAAETAPAPRTTLAERAERERNARREARKALPEEARNYRIESDAELEQSGKKTKFRQNVAAIRLLKQLEAENRNATPAEKAVLARFSGWGSLPQVFDERKWRSIQSGFKRHWMGDNPATWAQVQEQVKESDWMASSYKEELSWARQYLDDYNDLRGLLTDPEWKRAMESTINAHYTSGPVVRAMWSALEKMGFKGGRVLEPAMGSGNFYGLMPESMMESSELHGVELDSISGRLASKLYPEAQIQVSGFEDARPARWRVRSGHQQRAVRKGWSVRPDPPQPEAEPAQLLFRKGARQAPGRRSHRVHHHAQHHGLRSQPAEIPGGAC